jgi:phage terminase large subunit-like protein
MKDVKNWKKQSRE